MDTNVTGSPGVPGMSGASGTNGGSGTGGSPGGDAGATAGSSTDTTNSSEAAGGTGGTGGNGGNTTAPNQGGGRAGNGNIGGSADAVAATTAAGAATSATAMATGGSGGAGGFGGTGAGGLESLSGVGGTGGAATASASDTNTAGAATATATTDGGNGGLSQYDVPGPPGIYLGNVYPSGDGGVAHDTTAYAAGTTAATATVSQAGGYGDSGPAGGNGAASTLTNAVSGQTQGGTLTLNQTATGGGGGQGSIYGDGGAGGNATSNLTLTDTSSKVLNTILRATGGDGGENDTLTGFQESGSGGNATASDTVTGIPSGTMDLSVSAEGGDGRVAGTGTATAIGIDNGTGTGTLFVSANAEGGFSPEFGGAANALATATGNVVNVTASADGGEGGRFGGTGTAQATGNGTSGIATANAYSSRDVGEGAGGYYLHGPVATATAPVSGHTVVTAIVVDGGTLGAFDTTSQSVSTAVLDPSAAAYGSNLPAGYTLLLDTEEGGGSSSATVGTQTIEASFSIRLDTASLAPTADLKLDFPSATLIGTGVTSVVFTAEALGIADDYTDTETFSTGAQAVAYFSNNVIDLGTVADLTGSNNGTGLGIYFDLRVTTDSFSSGFYLDPVIGSSSACYCPGTRILTARGERPVEELEIGDELVTLSGRTAPIRWIGRRSHVGRFLAANRGVQPIVFRAGSLGDGLPRRDLLVSPDHAMFLDGLLVPARHLVNGNTVTQEPNLERVDYVHIELDRHDVLLGRGRAERELRGRRQPGACSTTRTSGKRCTRGGSVWPQSTARRGWRAGSSWRRYGGAWRRWRGRSCWPPDRLRRFVHGRGGLRWEAMPPSFYLICYVT